MAKNTVSTPIKDGVKADNTTYSSNKIEEIVSNIESEIPGLPEPAVGDIGKLAGVISDGSEGAKYGLVNAPAPYTGTKVIVIECTDAAIAATECAKVVEALSTNALVIAKVTAASSSAYQNLTIPYYINMAFDPSSTSAYFTLKGYTINTTDTQNATIIYLSIMGGESWGSVTWGTLNT